jgi:DNA-binding NtrC family response regulator
MDDPDDGSGVSWTGFGSGGFSAAEGGSEPGWTLDSAIGRQVLRVLRHTAWNKSEAARLLEISRSRLARLIEKFQLEEDG